LLKRWLQRQGWRNTGPWTWIHDAARLTISLAVQIWPAGTDQYTHIYPQKTAESKRSTAHFLRDAWRAHQWEQFLGCGSRAATSLHQLPWNAVKQQWQRARNLLSPESDLYRHLLAIYIDHWVSQARLRHTQNQPVLPYSYCGHHSPDRTHEWWDCPVLANTRLQRRTQNNLFDLLGWPVDHEEEQLFVSLAETRRTTLADRY
jgi:hypothetical protein